MDKTLLDRLATEPLPRVIWVHGPESVWQDQVYDVLRQRNSEDSMAQWNWSVFHGTKDLSLDPILIELATVPWGEAPKIVVLRDAHLVPTATMEKLVSWLQDNPEANCLALFFDAVDKRWKYLKVLRKLALEIECFPLEGERLTRYVLDYCAQRGKKMERVTVEHFLARADGNLNFIHNELEKLIAFVEGREVITAQDIQALTSLWPGQVADHTIFQLTDLIVQKKRGEALGVLKLLLSGGESPLRILPLIERQLRLVLAAKTSSGNWEATAQEMGESSAWALKKLRAQAKKFSLDEIFLGFQAVVQADGELKLGASGEEVLTDLIIKLT